ncbi:hypothetical protein [Gracilinema caldarium]|uniref:Uncharacterized protein n=1 Tax=Gracilinema caldarium (strain ATCC 51460 / DSM 7334 / H1) TaxID=744872 RepID=F8EXF8_GRAC1|nr:hypothetical protein [Gracilinema caldarium]AEJ19185.1 hypothetical protein Spica_1036 [Gracilinema caldarium DSM 7334]
MKKIVRCGPSSILFVVLITILFGSCDKLGFSPKRSSGTNTQLIKDESVTKPSLIGQTDPAWNSFGIQLPTKALQVIEVIDDVAVGNRAKDHVASLRPIVGNRSYMSTNRYEVEAPNQLSLRYLDESTFAGDALPDPAQLPCGNVQAVWKNPLVITAGPLACTNAVVLADAEPSLVLLDPNNLQLIQRFPVDGLIIAFTGFNAETAELTVLEGDLRTVTYRFLNETPELLDPINQYIGPSSEALRKIQEKTKQLLASSDTVLFERIAIFPIVSEIDVTKPVLFRLSVDTDGIYRIYLDGIGDIPVLLILFNEAGEGIFSNVEYAVEKVLEQNLEKGKTYYLGVSLFSGNHVEQFQQRQIPKLVVRPK